MKPDLNTSLRLRYGAVSLLVVFTAACGSRGDPRPPVYPNAPAITGLTVAQRGSFAILRFPQPELTSRVGSEDVEVESVEVLVYAERYPALTVDLLVAGLTRRRDVAVLDARSEAAALTARNAALAAALVAEEAGVELAVDPDAPATTVRRRSRDEDLIYRTPQAALTQWELEGLANDAILAAAQRLVNAVDVLWTRLQMSTTILDPDQPPVLPAAGTIAVASEEVIGNAAYERLLPVGTFVGRASVSRRIDIDQFAELTIDDMLQVAIPMGSPSPGPLRTRYFYAVRSMSTRRTAGLVAAVSPLAPLAVPIPPTALTNTVSSDGVELAWSPPTGDLTLRRVDGQSLRYNVYRMLPDGFAGPTPLNSLPLESPEYTDSNMIWGDDFIYEVRALLAGSGTIRRESEGVKTGTVVAIDVYPPAPPTNVVAGRAGRRVALQWTPSDSIDLIGYRVYRHAAPAPAVPDRFDPSSAEPGEVPPPREAGDELQDEQQERNEMVDAGWQLMTPEPVPFSRWNDADADPSVSYVYAVEAIDRAGNLSALGIGSESGTRDP